MHLGQEQAIQEALSRSPLTCVSICSSCTLPFTSGPGFCNHQAACASQRARSTRATRPPAPTSQLTPDALLSLCTNIVSTFKGYPVRRLKTAPLQAIRNLCVRLFQEISTSEHKAPAVVAFLGLPRILHSYQHDPNRLEAFLSGAAQCVPSSGPVLEAIATWTPPAQRRSPSSNTSNALPVRRITELVKSNNIGIALQTLESAHSHIRPADPEAARAAISALFPPRSDADLLSADLDASSAMQLSLQTVGEALRSLPRLRSSAFSGWTCDLIAALAREAPAFVQAFTGVTNAMLRGAAGPPALWAIDYVCPLEKKTGGYRPIVIGEIVPRIVGRIVAKSLAPQAAECLAPHQWGVGISGGSETVAHAVSLFYRAAAAAGATEGIQLIDFSNAFNCVRRGAIEAELLRRFPALVPYFRYTYGTPTTLRGVDGSPMATSETGVRQGDPLGPLLFCLALDAPLRELAARFPDIHIMCLLDDVTMLGPSASLPQALEFFARATEKIGLVVNRRKSVRLQMPREGPDEGNVLGARVLGCAVGPDDWVRTHIAERLEDYAAAISPVLTLPAQIATAILQAAVNARPVFTARTTLPALAADIFILFDLKIDNALAVITGSLRNSLPRESQILRALPQAKGGLAIARIAEIAAPAFAASLAAAATAIATTIPSLANHLSIRGQALSPVLEAARDVIPTHFAPSSVYNSFPNQFVLPCCWIAPSDLPNDEDAPYRQAPPRQKALVAMTIPVKESELDALLQGSPASRAIVKSGAFKGAAWWLAQPRFPLLRPSHAGMQAALALRLLLTPATVHPARRCGYCSAVLRTPVEELVHGMSCHSLQGLRTRRHTYLRDTLIEGLKKILGAHAVAAEVRFANSQVDITVTMGTGTRYLDLTVINAGVHEYLPAAANEGGGASAIAEAAKRARYTSTLSAHGIEPTAFVPFVIETTGRFGPAALQFIEDLRTAAALAAPERNRDDAIDYYVDRMKHHVLETNARIMHHAWAHLQPLQDEAHSVAATTTTTIVPAADVHPASPAPTIA